MQRTITVKGRGKASLKPDIIIVSFSLKNISNDYGKTIKYAAIKLDKLQQVLENIGFDKSDLKTTYFNVDTEYRSVRDKNDNFKNEFVGYKCTQSMKLEFDFDTDRLSNVLQSISQSVSDPELHIQFSVKDKEAVNKELLVNAAKNARAKAEVLTAASGVELGELLNIDYSWSEINLYSRTNYMMDCECSLSEASSPLSVDITPDNIDVSDTATFVWSIL